MKKATLLLLFALATLGVAFGQVPAEYTKLKNEAWELYQNEDYLQSGKKYSLAFEAFDGRGLVSDRYNAACSWALAGKPDSAFAQLFRITEKADFQKVDHLLSDSDLNSLHSDNRWSQLLTRVRSNKEKAEASINKSLAAILDTIYREDQKYRKQLGDVAGEYGWKSEEMNKLWRTMQKADSINLIKVKHILDKHGWLGADSVGRRGNAALFLVIQHADLETQENYLPMMREAVKKGNAQASRLALLEDRIALRKGEKQIYGSQIGKDNETGEYYVKPLRNPDKVNQRREEVGLGPIQNYIARWDITWDVEEYKKKLPEYLEKQKR